VVPKNVEVLIPHPRVIHSFLSQPPPLPSSTEFEYEQSMNPTSSNHQQAASSTTTTNQTASSSSTMN